MNGVSAAYRAAFLASDQKNALTFESYKARQLRYLMNWTFYESTAYDNLHLYSTGLRVDKGLYKHIRPVYNPAYRLATNYMSAIWGGHLDPDALEQGAIPISVFGNNESALRPAIARVWQDSYWQVMKDVHSLHGVSMGDAVLYIRNDMERGQARIEVMHPASLKDADMSTQGYIKSYAIEEQRYDNDGKVATYTETCERGVGDDVIFRTYRDGKPYTWDGNESNEWSNNWGFVPLVATQHNNVGLKWGWAEMHPIRGKIIELDDIASKLHDQIRKVVDAPGLITGTAASDITVDTPDPTTDNPQPYREQLPLIFSSNENVRYQSMVGNLNIADTMISIDSMIKELERDMPEMREDVWTGNVKEVGVKAAQDKVEKKVTSRRAGYDNGLVRALQMAIAISGEMGYDGFQGFGLDSYQNGALDFRIAQRPVFAVDRAAQISLQMQEIELAMMERGAGQEGLPVNA